MSMFFEIVPEAEITRTRKAFGLENKELFLELPKRASACAAGYDFVLPYDVYVRDSETVIVPTFVRVKLEKNRALFIYPRSSYGIKKGLVLANTVGIIDSDYFGSDVQGHIFIALKNAGYEAVSLPAGSRFAQGVIQEFFLVDGDDFSKGAKRVGGLGSTGEG